MKRVEERDIRAFGKRYVACYAHTELLLLYFHSNNIMNTLNYLFT